MTRQPSAADFELPETFIEDVMRRVDAAPRPMPVRSFWSAVLDRSAFDIVGSVAVAWRLLTAGGRVPVMVRAQALALVVLVAVSIGGTGTLAAAAAYRTVAPIVFRDDPRDLLSESVPTDAPDVIPQASPPIVVAVPDRPDGRAISRSGALSTTAADAEDGETTADSPPGKDRAARAEDEDDGEDRDTSDHGGGSGSSDGEDASDGEHEASDEDAPGDGDDGGDNDASDGEAEDGGESGGD